MIVDVTELRDFYGSRLGCLTSRLIAAKVHQFWPDIHGKSVFGIGYTTPYLNQFRTRSAIVGALMPAKQGVLTWPHNGPYRSLLVDEDRLPLPDQSVDYVLMAHCLEMSETRTVLLREVWRILTAEGRLLLIVPNRSGLWAHFDNTPFGHGSPFTRGQLNRLLENAMFTPLQWKQALFVPPSTNRLILSSAKMCEKLGATAWPALSGILIVDASKELYAPTGTKELKMRLRTAVPVPGNPYLPKNED